jgi:hypothetical protein
MLGPRGEQVARLTRFETKQITLRKIVRQRGLWVGRQRTYVELTPDEVEIKTTIQIYACALVGRVCSDM